MMVRPLSEADISHLMGIAGSELGEDYLDKSDFLDAMTCPEQFCFVGLIDGRPAGFAICRVFGPEGEADVLRLPDCPERDEVLAQARVGLLDSVSVSPSAKGRHLGTELCSACMDEFLSRGCTMVCAMAWETRDGRTNIGGILARLGMAEGISVCGYWNQFVKPGGVVCPVCGTDASARSGTLSSTTHVRWTDSRLRRISVKVLERS